MPVAAAPALLIAELESALRSGSPARRVRMLRQITDLFVSDADRLNENQIGVFDDVLVRLVERMEARTLIQLGFVLSGCRSAPREVIRQLAHHEEAAIAEPVLTRSAGLADDDLIGIAKSRGQKHLLAISSRKVVNEKVTDVLVERGDQGVSRRLAANAGARFSEAGFSTLAAKAADDSALAEALGLRPDFPEKTLRDLLQKATEAVRASLLKTAPPELRARIQDAIRTVAKQGGAKAPEPIDYTEAQNMAVALNRAGKLGDQTINRFAAQEEYPNIVAALSLLSTVTIETIEPLISDPRLDGLVIACRASRLNWSTTAMIISNRPDCAPASSVEVARAKKVFETLSLSAAQRTIRLWSDRSSAGDASVSEMAVAASGV
jgi:uncharacterized protein (DUF2336 family)